MSRHKEISSSVKILETALMAKDPFKTLLKMAEDFIKRGNFDELYNIDVMLTDRFIEYLRNGTIDDLEAFIYDVLAFTDSEIGDQLKEIEDGKSYFYRWEHFHDLCDAAIKGYDPKLIKRLIESRKHGGELMATLFENKDGIRHNELSKKLGISPQYLSKLLREFQEHDLVTRDSKDKVSIIRLGITGREYMKESEKHLSYKENEQIDDNLKDHQIATSLTSIIAQKKEEYTSTEPGGEIYRRLNNLNKIPRNSSTLWDMRLKRGHMGDHAFLFPGQGSQVPGMGKDLYLNTWLGKKTFDMADEILGYHFSKICFEGPEEELRLTYNSQPALLTVSYILYNLLGEVPCMAAGQGLGEYSALLCAGAIKYEDAVLLVHKRGKYMQNAVPVGKGAMAAIMGIDVEKIVEVVEKVKGIVDVASLNTPTQVVISGEKEAVEEAVERLAPRKVKFLPVSAPFHSELMRPAEEKLSVDLNDIEFKALEFPILNNIEADEVTTGEYARYSLKKQLSRPILWHNTIMKFVKKKEIKKFTEIGSGRVLTGLVERTARQEGFYIETYNIRDLEDLKSICKN